MLDQFHVFAEAVEARFRKLSEGELFTVQSEDLFSVYLGAFPDGTNPIYRKRTEHDCSCCKNFIRNIGHVVSIETNEIRTIWDLEGLPAPYDEVAKVLDAHVKSLIISGVFRTKEAKFGNQRTVSVEDGVTHTYNHFFCEVAARHRSATPDAARGKVFTDRNVLVRGLRELTTDALETVVDLIESNGLYRGAEFKTPLTEFTRLHRAYRELPAEQRDAFTWTNAAHPFATFRNTVIGTLAVDLSDNIDLDRAVRSFEGKVAPLNYKRPTALITPKMIEQAVDKLKQLGLESAINRRFARLADVSVNNVLFVDNSVRGLMKDSLTTLLMEEAQTAPVAIKQAQPIGIDEFLAGIVPQATSIDLLVENKHIPNFVSLTAPVHADAGRLFKWKNGFAWSYDGDAADSIKQRVKRAGGNVDARLRVSLAWSNTDDLDLHVHEPSGRHIYFGDRGDTSGRFGGFLDVDMNCGFEQVRDPVENIAWTKVLADGVYRVSVHNFHRREGVDVGFSLEVECNGVIHAYTHQKAVPDRMKVDALTITMKDGMIAEIKVSPDLVGGHVSQNKWGVKTEQLVRVNTLLASPNHWDGQEIGNKHWFFILKDCVNPDPARGIYNEFLKGELEPHRKVFEVLGAKTKCPPTEDQLSGIGFSSTRKDVATVVVKGSSINKTFNIQF